MGTHIPPIHPRQMKTATILSCTLLLTMSLFTGFAHGKSAKVINVEVDDAINRLSKKVQSGKEFLESAKGILVFPSITKAGFVLGGEYGAGALRARRGVPLPAGFSTGFFRDGQFKTMHNCATR